MAASVMLSFGGLCVLLQTRSVTRGLSLKYYCLGKLIQTVFGLALWDMVLYRHWIPGVILGILALILRKTENRGRIMAASGV